MSASRISTAPLAVDPSARINRHLSRRLGARLTAATLTASCGVGLLTAGPAQADPRPRVERVADRVEVLRHRAEQASERFNETREQIASISVRIRAARARLARQREQVRLTRVKLGALAAEMYQYGELSALELLLGDQPDAVLARAGLTSSVADRQASLVQSLRLQQRQLARNARHLARQRRSLSTKQRHLARQRTQVLANLRAAEDELGRLRQAEVRQIFDHSRAADRAGIGQALDRAARRGSREVLIGRTSGPGIQRCGRLGVAVPDDRVSKVLAFACAQLGDPYRWGSAGPASWDCSGFTMRAWAQGGVGLPHSSRMQYGAGRPVSRSQLRAGDLVFFYQPISHVGIYLGDGLMIAAPSTGDVVKISAVHRGFAGAVRL